VEPDRALARIARRQHGLISRAQAHTAGLSDAQLLHRVHRASWRRVLPGVYAFAGAPVTYQQRVLAACLATGPHAAASHETAAHLLGLSPFTRPPERVHLLAPAAHSARTPLATVHRTLALPPSDICMVARIPVTRPARTLLDIAGHVPRATLEEAVDDAVIRRLTSLDRLGRRLDELRASGRPGSRAVGEVLATWTDDMPQSLAEMRLVRRLVAGGVPQPTLQHEVWHAGRLVARLDLAWPDAKVGYELDSRRWHSSPAAHQRDVVRHNQLRALGWTVFQATPAQLRDDGRRLAEPVLARLHSEIEARPCA